MPIQRTGRRSAGGDVHATEDELLNLVGDHAQLDPLVLFEAKLESLVKGHGRLEDLVVRSEREEGPDGAEERDGVDAKESFLPVRQVEEKASATVQARGRGKKGRLGEGELGDGSPFVRVVPRAFQVANGHDYLHIDGLERTSADQFEREILCEREQSQFGWETSLKRRTGLTL